MPEGQEDMPNTEGASRPISPEAGKNVEKPISDFSFREAWARRQKLTRQKETVSGDALAKIEADIAEVKKREDFLVGEVEQEGGLMDINQEFGILREMLNVGQLSPSHLFDAQKMAPQLDNLAGIDSSDPHAGVREWYFRKNLEGIIDDLRVSVSGTLSTTPNNLVEQHLERIVKATEATTSKLQEEEPEVEKIPIPETAAECVEIVEDRLFGLLSRSIVEKKGTKNFENEFRAIEGFIKRIPETNLYKGEIETTLSQNLYSRFPEGVFLKEKLTLFLEAMRNLTDRTVEVVDSEGSLLKLGAEKSEVALAKELQISFTNISPVNWYILCHIGNLFPETASVPETRVDLQKAWEIWKSIGDKPYRREGSEWKAETILDNSGRFVEKDSRVVTNNGITLESIYKSEAVEQLVRNSIVKEIGNGNRTTGSVRSELLAWCFLKVGLTFDMWDRKRWKIKGDSGARDLIWFPYKQISRMAAERSGGGVLDTAGSYWAYEGQQEVARRYEKLIGKQAEKLSRILKRNEEKRNVFLVKGNWEAEGTIVGDFWSSTAFNENGHKIKLKTRKLEEIPWLNPNSQIEEGTYSGYFGYSLGLAKAAVDSFMKTGGRGWGVEEFCSQDFWKGERDLLVRLPDYCPLMLTKNDEPVLDSRGDLIDRGNDERIQLIARTFARGIFWLGSYQSQPDRDFMGIPLPRKGLYTYDQKREILRAIKGAGFLTEDHYKGLLRDIQEYNFYGRAATVPQRR